MDLVNATSTRPSRTEQVSPAVLLLVLVIVLMPIPRILVQFTPGNGSYDFQAILFPSDLPLAILTLTMIPRALRRIRDGSFGILAWLALALTAWMTVAYVLHPSDRGVADLLRLLGLVATIVAFLDLKTTGERGIVLASMAGVAAFETVVSVIQIATRSSVGLGVLGESSDPLWSFGSTTAPQGTTVHPYVLAGLALVFGVVLAIALTRGRNRALLLATAVAIVPVGYTYGRAALLGLAIALVCLGTGLFVDRRRYLPAILALCIGVAVPALIWNDGWRARTQQSVHATSASSLTTDRGWLIHEADGLIVDQPIVGVGPGRYVMALKDKFGKEPNKTVGVFKPVHNLPLLAAAEGGVPAGLLMTALLLVAGWRGWVAGRTGLALWGVYMPFVLLDHFGYTYPMGLIITGVWLGVIELLARDRKLSPLP
ncbi:MAG: O-antigen ligase family protein [Acidimicrobiia bacterium]|nr:O-antigen ligase family protein [Acidimicrobiia bacterium]